MLSNYQTMLKFVVIASVLVLQVFGSPVSIPRSLEKSLQANGKVDIFLSLESPKSLLSQLKVQNYASRVERKMAVASSLKRHASRSQKSLMAFLSSQTEVSVKSFWITNEIYVKGADAALISKLVQRSEVFGIREELKEGKVLPVIDGEASVRSSKALEWGLQVIDVQPVWDAGFNGTGVRVGILDTGVMPTHEALRDSYVGEYGWFAPIYLTDGPEDTQGHGTHVMGTILGQGGIGVAPGAQWMACQNIPGNEAEDLACGQFMLCPHLPDGSNPDCSKGADLVSNSWGYPGGNDFFDNVFEAWAAAGIVPIFSAGNSGPSCNSIGSPGDSSHPALISVGSTTKNEVLSSFSSFGPSPFGVSKPDIAAPGSDVRSSCISCDSCYCNKSGTSMASPHVAGVVALILSAEPLSTIDEIEALLYSGAAQSVSETGRHCGGIPESTYPNNHVGHGRLSASNSVLSLLKK